MGLRFALMDSNKILKDESGRVELRLTHSQQTHLGPEEAPLYFWLAQLIPAILSYNSIELVVGNEFTDDAERRSHATSFIVTSAGGIHDRFSRSP